MKRLLFYVSLLFPLVSFGQATIRLGDSQCHTDFNCEESAFEDEGLCQKFGQKLTSKGYKLDSRAGGKSLLVSVSSDDEAGTWLGAYYVKFSVWDGNRYSYEEKHRVGFFSAPDSVASSNFKYLLDNKIANCR